MVFYKIYETLYNILIVFCIYLGNESVIKILVENGADVNKKTYMNETPADVLYEYGK